MKKLLFSALLCCGSFSYGMHLSKKDADTLWRQAAFPGIDSETGQPREF